MLVYINGSSPTELELAAAARFIAKDTRLSYRNARFWHGETETPVDAVLTDAPGIRAAYEKAGTEVYPITPKKRRGRPKKDQTAMLDEPED